VIPWEKVKGTPAEKIGMGVYAGVPYEEYSSWPHINHSRLRAIGPERTLAHARYDYLHPVETKAKTFGHAFHIAVLEPHRFDEECVVAPDNIGNRSTKAGKLAWQQFMKRAEGRTILTPQEGETIEGIRASLAEHALANPLLTGPGFNEVTVVFEIERQEIGLPEGPAIPVKARLDRYTSHEGWPIVLDMKSFGKGPASRHDFEGQAHRLHYWEQAALYLDAINAAAPFEGEGFRLFWWLVCETTPPYCVRIIQADDIDGGPLAWGRDQYRKQLRQWVQATESGVWPGWGEGVELAGLPGWVTKTFAEEG